ncbi:MAG: hypothetical protein JRC53_04285 [Deltaproteobacteria bacterium]|nr:hypothetical protein [Deltaproteobacteria bacterium]
MGTISVFIHGLESSSQGNKGVFFRKKYPDMIIEDYPGSLGDRMTRLRGILSDKRDIVLIGSSYGGILLAPAINLEEFKPYLNRKIKVPVILYHGNRDDVVPLKQVYGIASKIFQNLSHHIVDDDHPLSETFTSFDWDTLLGD